jgi:hypothetical protein
MLFADSSGLAATAQSLNRPTLREANNNAAENRFNRAVFLVLDFQIEPS